MNYGVCGSYPAIVNRMITTRHLAGLWEDHSPVL